MARDGSDQPTATADLAEAVAALAPWFHNIDLGGVLTAPDHFLGDYPAEKFARFGDIFPADLTGKTVLDVGCNAGFYSVEALRRGAARVVGIDSDERYLAQARLATGTLGFRQVEFRALSVYDVAALREQFDLVIFMGVLYHLRHPLLALDLIREHVARDLLLFQTMQQGSRAVAEIPADHPFFLPGTDHPPPYFDDPGYPKLHFIEQRFAGDWTNWWAPNAAAAMALLRAAGFALVDRADGDVYLARVTDVPFAAFGRHAVYPAH